MKAIRIYRTGDGQGYWPSVGESVVVGNGSIFGRSGTGPAHWGNYPAFRVLAVRESGRNPHGRDGVAILAMPADNSCFVQAFLSTAYALGVNPLPAMREAWGGKWEFLSDTRDYGVGSEQDAPASCWEVHITGRHMGGSPTAFVRFTPSE